MAYIKRLSISGRLPTRELPDFLDRDVMRYFKQFEETLGEQPHRAIVNNDVPAFIQGASNFDFKENCRYSRKA